MSTTAKWAPESWVLLRGLGREGRHWFDFPERLHKQRAAVVSVIDLPGIGQSSHQVPALTVRGLAEQTRRAWRQSSSGELPARAGSPVGIIAISLGAMVAIEWARAWPQEVGDLVLINSSSKLSAPHRRLTPTALVALLRASVEKDPYERERIVYGATTNGSAEAVQRLARGAAEIAQDSRLRRRAIVRQLIAAARFAPGRVRSDVLVLSSDADRFVEPECSQRLAGYLGAAQFRHPTAGHDLPLEDPDWVIARIGDWIEQRAKARRRLEGPPQSSGPQGADL